MINSFRRMRTGKPDGCGRESGRGRERKRQQLEQPGSPEARRLFSHGERRAAAKSTVPARVGGPGSRAAAAPAKSTVPARVGCPGSRAAAAPAKSTVAAGDQLVGFEGSSSGYPPAAAPRKAHWRAERSPTAKKQLFLEFKGVSIVNNKFVN